jgi:cell division transport system permease protein
MFTSFTRVFKFAINDFGRNKGISIATTFILVIAIMLVTGLYFFHGAAGYLTVQIQNKIDITAYFVDGTPEEDILAVKDEIIKISPDVRSIEYVSKDQALASFTQAHQDNAVLQRALAEVGDNPFLPSLNIVTNGDPAQYEEVANTMQNSDFSNLISKIDFSQKKNTIEKVYTITSNINKYGLVIGIILIILSALVVFNTIKLAIDSSKDEISTMKIVGASDWFVRGPFIMEGVIYGVIAFMICILFSALFAYLLSPEISTILPGFNLYGYFLTNLWIFVLIQLLFGVGVGVVSSFIVVKKYLDI